jgi:ferredoxin
MRVVVDLDRCESHGLCAAAVAEVFDLGDDDVLRIEVDTVPDSLRPRVEEAIARCPKQALSMQGD